jgi:D-alanine-D-alanine ligase
MAWQTSPLTVAVLAGGPSAEHDVSLSSAASVTSGLQAAGHKTLQVTITRDLRWLCEGTELKLAGGAGLLGADVVFPALHGPFGEDGTLQGVLEALDVAYVGAGVAASAICMHKLLFKQLMGAAGIDQVDYLGVTAERFASQPGAVLAGLERLGLPVFVKPSRMGSSVGIVRVSEAGALHGALEHAFAHDHVALVEAAASGVEVECAVLGSALSVPDPAVTTPPTPGQTAAKPGLDSRSTASAALASEPGQVSFGGDWYDYDTKYRPGGIELQVPAPISATAADRVRTLAVEVFERVECRDLARVDFFVDGDRVLVNELNTMPGFTPTSVYAKLIEHGGTSYPALVDHLCRTAHHRRRAQLAGV